MKHKHYDSIIAWANGAKIQDRAFPHFEWRDSLNPSWWISFEYRIKPEPKPDCRVSLRLIRLEGGGFELDHDPWKKDNFIATFDGETGKLKSVELIDKL